MSNIQYGAEKYVLKHLKNKYFGYKFVSHRKNKDYIQRKGLFRKPTGLVIKKEDMIWETANARMNAQQDGGPILNVFVTVYLHIDKQHKIILYRF